MSPVPLPLHVHSQISRHGKRVWYFRRGHGPRIRLHAGPGEKGFEQAYAAALAAYDRPSQKRTIAAPGTLQWLVDRYRETSGWAALSTATRKQREAIIRQVLTIAADAPVRRITKATIVSGIDRRAATPFQAKHYLDAMRHLFSWAHRAALIEVNPTEGVRAPPTPRSDGFAAWEPEDIALFERRWPIGTRERVALDVLRYTGLRRGDAVMLGRQHVRDGVIRFRTGKTGERVTIAVADALAETLSTGPAGELTFIAGANGCRMTKESFGNWFRDACRAAGVNKSAHGLRKWFAIRLAEEGASEKELQAACGWTSGRMAAHYTRRADRERLGLAGSKRLK